MLLRVTWLGCAIAVATLLAQSAPEEQVAGTVQLVKPEAGEVVVLTGVGHAVRRRLFHAGPECAITVAGAAAQLRELVPGAVVVVRYRMSQGRDEAESIAAQSPERTGRGG